MNLHLSLSQRIAQLLKSAFVILQSLGWTENASCQEQVIRTTLFYALQIYSLILSLSKKANPYPYAGISLLNTLAKFECRAYCPGASSWPRPAISLRRGSEILALLDFDAYASTGRALPERLLALAAWMSRFTVAVFRVRHPPRPARPGSHPPGPAVTEAASATV